MDCDKRCELENSESHGSGECWNCGGQGSEKQRTPKQNASLHVYARLLAKTLADAGLDMREIIQVPIVPTEENVKAEMIKPVMRALYPKAKSTSELSTKQIQTVYETTNQATAESLHVSIDWPSVEAYRNKSLLK